MKTTTANPVTSEMSHSRTTFMVKLALMVAIIFVMAFSPLGYLRTPGLTITFLTVPVAVGAIILGPTAGAICGGAFGLTSAIMALTGGSAFSAALLQINPFGLLFTVLVPRILEGWLCGLIFAALKKVFKNGAFIIASLALFLEKEDKEKLISLGGQLGYLDTQMQERTLLLYLEQLELSISGLRGEIREKCRLSTALGVMGSLFLVIVMF